MRIDGYFPNNAGPRGSEISQKIAFRENCFLVNYSQIKRLLNLGRGEVCKFMSVSIIRKRKAIRARRERSRRLLCGVSLFRLTKTEES